IFEKTHTAARSWMFVLLIAAGLYILGTMYNFFMLPRPTTDRPAVELERGENRRNIFRTGLIIILGVGIFLLLDSGVRLIGGSIFDLLNRNRAGAPVILPDWRQSIADMRYWATMHQVGLGIFIISSLLIRKNLRGTVMATAFISFASQRRFWAIFLFIMFYRFGEAMVTRVLPLFLKDPISHGGLAVSTEDVGLIVGTAGVLGIIVGGLIGGWVVARIGLKKSIWPLAIAMHLPNIFYLLIAIANHKFADPNAWPNRFFHDWILYIAAFVHEFAYGFGFAAYSLFLMMIAQRREFKTAHYAFGTGLGALCGVAAGIVSAILLASVNYVWFFVAVCALTIPGMLTLLVIPLE
ncbi:MAG TPA: hypothetical protein VG722_10160, partial [Tepidisphaeraceae bacterium]|nr:hypothetical protein [Tepidisphaeraceae bacterium]